MHFKAFPFSILSAPVALFVLLFTLDTSGPGHLWTPLPSHCPQSLLSCPAPVPGPEVSSQQALSIHSGSVSPKMQSQNSTATQPSEANAFVM